MLNFYASCFDIDTDSTPASVAGFTLPVSTGELHEGQVISKFFVEGALLFATNQCEAFGFVRGSDEKKFGAVWRVPGVPQAFSGVIDFSNGQYTTNAKNNFARQGLGLLGLGAAFASHSPSFRAAWVDFLNKLTTGDAVTAVNATSMSALSVEASKGLERQSPNGSWVYEEAAAIKADAIEDLRNHFVNVEDFLNLSDAFESPPEYETRFQGPQLKIVRNLLKRRKHTVLLGPPGVGKTISAFEALALEGYSRAGTDYQLFSGHDEVKSADFLGSWQPNGEPGKYVWVNGCLVRAMTANGGQGQPILVEEFTRMPTRAQNMFISALSDGYVVLNEKPDDKGDGEIVRAGPNFVLLADMNVDPSADDIELYGAAFSSRVRKVEYEYPSTAGLLQILAHDVPETSMPMRTGIIGTYDTVMKRWAAAELSQPISPRACVQWAEEIVSLTADVGKADSTVVRAAAWSGAELTWLRDVAGTDAKVRKAIMADVEAQFRKAYLNVRGKVA